MYLQDRSLTSADLWSSLAAGPEARSLRELGAPSAKSAARLRAIATGIRAALLGVVLAGTASAQTIVISFAGFAPTGGLTINSAATIATTADGSVLRLVAAPNTNQAGSAFAGAPVNANGFSTAFDFRLTSPGGISDGQETGADGFTFTLQTVGATSVGPSGTSLGYGGISPSVAVEFDTFFNSGDDPSLASGGSNHLAVDTNGNLNSAANAVGVSPRFDNGVKWTAWIDYNGTVLEVRVSDTGVRPASPTLTRTINLASTLGSGNAYVGFTAGTGSAFANHDILDWAYSDTFVSGGISPPLAVPEPATYELILIGAGLVWLRRRRLRLAR
jgi:hypothetical protein